MSFFYSIAYVVMVFALVIFIWIAYHVLREKQKRDKHPETLPSYYNRNIGDVSLTTTAASPREQRAKISGTFLALPIVAAARGTRKHKKGAYVSYDQSYQRGMVVEPAIGVLGLANEGDVDINADVHETENIIPRQHIDMPDKPNGEQSEPTNEHKNEPLIPSETYSGESKSDNFFTASSDSYGVNDSAFSSHGGSSHDYGSSSHGGYDGGDAACDGGGGVGTDC